MEYELLARASSLQEQSEENEHQLQFVNEQIHELEQFREHLTIFENGDKKEILASLGRGVSIPAQITDTKLFVEVGAGVVVRKTPTETRKIIAEQIQKFEEVREQLQRQLQSQVKELGTLMQEIQKTKQELEKKG